MQGNTKRVQAASWMFARYLSNLQNERKNTMSADRLGVCPNCNRVLSKKAKDAYGKVSEDEYLAIVEEVGEPKTSLREDYEIWTDPSGKFTIVYSCSCHKCNFSWTYKYTQQIVNQKEPASGKFSGPSETSKPVE